MLRQGGEGAGGAARHVRAHIYSIGSGWASPRPLHAHVKTYTLYVSWRKFAVDYAPVEEGEELARGRWMCAPLGPAAWPAQPWMVADVRVAFASHSHSSSSYIYKQTFNV